MNEILISHGESLNSATRAVGVEIPAKVSHPDVVASPKWLGFMVPSIDSKSERPIQPKPQSRFPRQAVFYGVRTTRIFCLLGCRSRQPRPENVVFFNSPKDALKAGYRACKRCQPSGAGEAATMDARIFQACRWLASSDDQIPLFALARSAGMSPFHFHRLFKARVGVTPK